MKPEGFSREIKSVACVQCGFCCTVRCCPFGLWDKERHRCVYLTEDMLCSKYDEIKDLPGADESPAFGAGCCSSLFNSLREEKIRKRVKNKFYN